MIVNTPISGYFSLLSLKEYELGYLGRNRRSVKSSGSWCSVGRRREDPPSSQPVGHVQAQVVVLLVPVGRQRGRGKHGILQRALVSFLKPQSELIKPVSPHTAQLGILLLTSHHS